MVRVRDKRAAQLGGSGLRTVVTLMLLVECARVGAAPSWGWSDSSGFTLEMAAAEPRPLHIESPFTDTAKGFTASDKDGTEETQSDSPLSDASEKVEKVLRRPFAFSFNKRRDQRQAASSTTEPLEDQTPAAIDYYKRIEELRKEEKEKEGGHKGLDIHGTLDEGIKESESEQSEEVVEDNKGEQAEPAEDKVNHEEDKEAADSKHHDHKHKGGSHHHAKGGGKTYHSEHHGTHGEKGDKGYKGHHHHEKGSKGHHKKENHNNHYDEKAGHENEHHHDDGYHAQHEKGEEGKKGSKFHEEGEHSKGHSTKGEHNIRKTDEFEKKQEFYEESHEGGDFEKDGEFYHEDGYKKGGHEKGGHEHGGEEHSHHGKESKHESGGHHKDDKGHKEAGGHDSHHDHHSNHGKKDSHSGGKRWHYKEGDDGNSDNDGKHSAQQIVIQPQNAQDVASTLRAVKELLSPLLVLTNMDQSSIGVAKEESQHSKQYQLPEDDNNDKSGSDPSDHSVSFLDDNSHHAAHDEPIRARIEPVRHVEPVKHVELERQAAVEKSPTIITVKRPEEPVPNKVIFPVKLSSDFTNKQPSIEPVMPQQSYRTPISDESMRLRESDIDAIIETFKKENILPPDPPTEEEKLEPKATSQDLDTTYDQYMTYIRGQMQPNEEASGIRERYKHYKYIPPKMEALEAFTEASNQVKSIQDPQTGKEVKQLPTGFKVTEDQKGSPTTTVEVETKDAPCPKEKEILPDGSINATVTHIVATVEEEHVGSDGKIEPIVAVDHTDGTTEKS